MKSKNNAKPNVQFLVEGYTNKGGVNTNINKSVRPPPPPPMKPASSASSGQSAKIAKP